VTGSESSKPESRLSSWLDRRVGKWNLAVLVGVIVTAPWVLYFHPISFSGGGHIPRDPAAIYRLYSDDFAYVSGSRTFSRALSNLFVPHNAHIVPAWRILTWSLVAAAGSLFKLPEVLAVASYGILVAVMLLTGRLVARETGCAGLGLAAMVGVGTTSVAASPACWYSAGQTLWAAYGILATLWYAQCWRRSPNLVALALAALWAMLSGWFWSIGHVAGPVATIYLWRDGRPRCKWAAGVPLAATALAVAISFSIGGKKIDTTVSFHGRTPQQAAKPVEGVLYTLQAIPENLVLRNLGLRSLTTPVQGIMLTSIILGSWGFHRLRQGGLRAFNPLECAGVALVLASYLVEWTFRGYMDFRYLRTINMGMIVPWYDTVPQVGAVLFLAGWWAGPRCSSRPLAPVRSVSFPRHRGVIAILGLMAILMVLNAPRVDLLWRNWVPPPTVSELKPDRFPTVHLQDLRATLLLLERAEWQRRHLLRLDQAQQVGSRLGIGLDGIRATFGRLDAPDLPNDYDTIGLLDLPDKGSQTNPEVIRRALGPYLFKEPEPRPRWLPPDEKWPPPDRPHWTEGDVDGAG
jgi:hypothetical protein